MGSRVISYTVAAQARRVVVIERFFIFFICEVLGKVLIWARYAAGQDLELGERYKWIFSIYCYLMAEKPIREGDRALCMRFETARDVCSSVSYLRPGQKLT